MIREFNYSFNELVIDQQLMAQVMGYGDCPLPDPFNEYLETALTEASNLSDIRAICQIIEDAVIDESKKTLFVRGYEFKIGRTVCDELEGSEKLAFFVCTAGKKVSEKSAKLLMGDDPVLGYVYDLLGSAIAEAAGDKMQAFLKNEVEKNGETITNRYSPGYCHWSVADQHKLFSLFEGDPCGVTLTQSALMNPVKSISGVIGIGKNVKYREFQCTLCLSENCVYRKFRGL